MPASRTATHRSSAETEIESDLARVDAHEITPEEYEEIPEITDEMVARAKFYVGGQPVARDWSPGPDAGEPVSIELAPAVARHFRAGGPGWQARINDILLEVVRREDKVVEGGSVEV